MLALALVAALAAPTLCSTPEAQVYRTDGPSGARLWLASLTDGQREGLLDGLERLAIRRGGWYWLGRRSGCTHLAALDPEARFSAWPAGYAVVLQVAGGRAGEVAHALRVGLGSDGVGVVISGADGAPAEALRLARAAQRIQKRVDRLAPDLARHLDGLTRLDRPDPDPALIAPDEVWVVPKLSALPAEPTLRAAVAGLVAGAPVRWLSRAP